MLLAIDTATHVSGLALYNQDGLHVEQMWYTGDNHTVELMPFIAQACKQQNVQPADLRAVAISLGPGSFTGLRVGLSVAKGLALALQIPVLGIPTLDATAYAHSREQVTVCAVLPAGRGRWVAGWYRSVAGIWKHRGDYALTQTNDLGAQIREPTLVCGEFDEPLVQALRAAAPQWVMIASPALAIRRAGYLAELAWNRLAAGEHDDPASLTPIYLQTV